MLLFKVARVIGKQKIQKAIWIEKGRSKISLFADNMTLHVENPKNRSTI
jgi:hypothetical protein